MGTHFLGRNIAILLLFVILASCNDQEKKYLGNISDTDTIVVDVNQLSDLLENGNPTLTRKAVIELVRNPVKNSFVLDSFLCTHSKLVKEIVTFEDDDAQLAFLSNLDYNDMRKTLSQTSSLLIAKGKNAMSYDLRSLAYFYKASEYLLIKNLDSLGFYLDLVNLDSSQFITQYLQLARKKLGVAVMATPSFHILVFAQLKI
jgi:hypothetical protein